jgi:lipopolysaccharide/colanic/teichoic acid biosynthesis glycosyltransferase
MTESAKASIPASKRALDLTVCALALPVLAPVMALAAVLIKVSSPGPIFYHAKRAGYKGRTFLALKFRTMRIGSDRFGAVTADGDSRVFAVGRILRLFKIDELPQIINILKGEMSIVGPRPEDSAIVQSCYTAENMSVLEVAPGLTGLPQVRFFPELSLIHPGGMDPQDHYRKVVLPMRLDMDREYIRRRSFIFDVYLIGYTLYLILIKSWVVLIFGTRRVGLPQ